jgi:rhodanese-related sulfurtransferase
MKQISRFLTFLFAILVAMSSLANDEFPNRKLFPETTPISLDKLKGTKNNSIIIDVRSAYEFDTLHIKDAINIPLNASDFTSRLETLRKDSNKPIVFYCNGKTCKKSYKAALKAVKAKIPSVFVFDAGIFDWARAYPEESILLGKLLEDKERLISSSDLKKHMLDHKTFVKQAKSNKVIILDIRDPVQRDGLQIFAHRENVVPLDNAKLQKYVDKSKKENKTLMIYDAVGKQVRWLQYYLEDQRVKNYYFMKGGAEAHFEDFIAKYRKKL